MAEDLRLDTEKMNDEARKKPESLVNENPEKFNQAVFELNIDRDASIKGWCVEVMRNNGDYVRLDITDCKLKDMGIELTREDIELHIDELINLLKCSDVE